MLISSDPTTATATTTTASHARCPPSPISPDPDSSTSPRSLSLPLSHSLLCSRSSSAFPPTPPDDDTHVSWDDTTPQPLLSPKPMHAVQQTPDGRETAGCEDASSASEASCASLSSSNGSSSSSPVDSDPEKRKIVLREGIEDWLRRCLANALSYLQPNGCQVETVKVVSQVLPYPRAPEISVKLPTEKNISYYLIQAINDNSREKIQFVNVTHAVPEHFTLSNLPASPSVTPRSRSSGDGYFTSSSVFSSAAVASSYHDFRGPINRCLRSPSYLVPPQTVQAAVLERYIPPASLSEHRDFFHPTGPSHLVDRMCELSPDGSALLLIYPTKHGVRTFQERYIAPVLDPLIRQLVVVNGMSADLGQFLGRHSFAMDMEDLNGLQERINELCETLSDSTSRFELVDAETANVFLDRNLWGEWYVQQERKRFKDVLHLNPYHSEGSRSPDSGNVHRMFGTQPGMSSSMMLTTILDGLRKRAYCATYRPPAPVELGIFVIRRCAGRE